MELIDEKTLVMELCSGSEKAYNLLYRQWVSRLYRFVYGYVKSKSITEDIVQETFVRLWLHRSELNPEKSFKSYIFTISYHLLLKELRHQLQNPLVESYITYLSDVKTSDNEASSVVEYDEFEKALLLAKGKLSPRQREIFELNKEKNISIADIANELAINEHSVRKCLSAALKVIRTELSDFSYIIYLIMFYNI